MAFTNIKDNGEKNEMEKTVTSTSKTEIEEISALIKKTDKENPKPEDVKALRKMLETEKYLYRDNGNVQSQIFQGILGNVSKHSAFFRECSEKYIEEMKAELGFHSSTFVEKMLIDEIVMRWLRLQIMENDHNKTLNASHTLAIGIYYDKRLHLAHKRYLHSIETLAKARKMLAQTQAKGAEMFKNLMTNNSDK